MKKFQISKIFISILIISNSLYGQQWLKYNPTYGFDINSIAIPGPGVISIGGGWETNDSIQIMFQTSDYGISWYENAHDGLAPWNKSIAFSDNLNGYGVGNNGRIIKSGDAGRNWGWPTSPIDRSLNKIVYVSGGTYFVAGGKKAHDSIQTILKSNNFGITWNVIYDTAGPWLKSIYFKDTLTGYAVGDSSTVLQTIDGGFTWQQIIIDSNLSINESYNAVEFYSKGFGTIGGKSGVLYVYRNPGVEAFTLGSEQIGTTTATVKGVINTNNKTAKYSFVYSNSLLFSGYDTTNWVNVQNDTLLLISESLQNLNPNNQYFYFLRAISSFDTVCGDTLTFYTGINPSFTFQTIDADIVSPSSVIFKGFINKCPDSINLFFEYGIDPSFGNQMQPNPSSMHDTLMHAIHAYVNGLQINTQYFFRLKGVTSMGTYYGDTKTFFTFPQPPILKAEPSTGITLNSAILNGQVNHALMPLFIYFEYGKTKLFENEIPALPQYIDDTLIHSLKVKIDGLEPNTFYYYRIKAKTSDNFYFYSEIHQLYTAACEVPNCSFELWDSIQVQKPLYWTTIGNSERVPSYNGSNAVQLGGGSGASAVFSGKVGKGFSGGTPFSVRPDSIVCHVKHNILSGDTAYVLASFKKNGSTIYQIYIPVTGSSGGNFKRISYPLAFPTSDIPDSIATGAVNSNAIWGQSNPGSVITIDDLSFIYQGSTITVTNSDFEEWDNINYQIPSSWYINSDNVLQAPDLVRRTTDKINGKYAVILENNPYLSNKPTTILIGDKYKFNRPTFAMNLRHETFNFYAKYHPQNMDSLMLVLYLYSNGIKIGGAILMIDTVVSEYSPFNVEIQYTDSISIPDSADLNFCVGIHDSHGNSTAWIDNLSFDGFGNLDSNYSEISEILSDMLLNIYPNPANENVYIEYYNHSTEKISISIFDINGRMLYFDNELFTSQSIIKRQIDISGFTSGIYLVRVVSEGTISTRKLIINK